MKTKVVNISVEAQVLSYALGAQEATLSLSVNGIPTIELSCAPSEPNLAYKPLVPNVVLPHLSQFADMYRELSIAAEGLDETGYIEIKVSGDDNDSIVLRDWVLSGVGLSNASAVAAPHLNVIFQHPICRLTKVGSIYETPRSDESTAMNEAVGNGGATNLLQIMKTAYRCARSTVEYWPCPPGFEVPVQFRQQLGVGEFDPERYLVWKNSGGNGIFLAGSDSGLQTRIAQAIARMVFPNSTGSSTWDMISGASGSLLVSVTQDESNNFLKDKLVLEPTQPWKNASITIPEDRCAMTELPGMNPFRIVGVMARKLGPYADPINLGFLKNGNDNEKPPVAEVVYVPSGVEVSAADGRIIKTSAPAVLDSAFRRDAPYGQSISQGLIDMEAARADGYNKVIGKYCKAVYEITTASMVQARCQLALSFHLGGRLVLPGNTCKLVSEGKTIYYGYINDVIHHVSTQGGNSTTIKMSYVRPEEAFKIKGQVAIKAGSPNAAYE